MLTLLAEGALFCCLPWLVGWVTCSEVINQCILLIVSHDVHSAVLQVLLPQTTVSKGLAHCVPSWLFYFQFVLDRE